MDSSSLQSLLCGVGVALVAYSRTFPRWLHERALERYLAAQETIAVMRAKLEQYEKVQGLVAALEKEAEAEGVFASKKEELEFKLKLVEDIAARNDILLMANAKMEVATEALEKCGEEMAQRARESAWSLIGGGAFLLAGLFLIIRK
jgi:hypothetical protein